MLPRRALTLAELPVTIKLGAEVAPLLILVGEGIGFNLAALDCGGNKQVTITHRSSHDRYVCNQQ